MMTIRKSSERGHIQLDWLNTYHTFSFGEYHDPAHTHFRSLRVINEDYIQENSGFPFHSHQDMEILTYIISGELKHKDSLGNTSVIRRGEVQLMRAGSGINHSEFNPSLQNKVHLLQIWIFPANKGLQPLYQQKQFHLNNNLNKLVLIASPDGQDDSFTIVQDAKIYAAILNNRSVKYPLPDNRHVWLQVVHGIFKVNNLPVESGDGLAISDETLLNIHGNGEFLLFDLS